MLRRPLPAFLAHLPPRPPRAPPRDCPTRAMAAPSAHPDAVLRKASRKAVAIALNYADHAREMASPAARDAPFWFFKPSTAYLPPAAGPILLPAGAVVHHEELGVVIGKAARCVRAEDAFEHVAGYVCAIDLTARNWQKEAKERGRPWSLAKGCDTFLPFSDFVPRDDLPAQGTAGDVDAHLYLDVNGERRQSGNARDMIWKIPELIEHVSAHCTLEEWDMILTGTPAGVGEVKPGDVITAGIQGVVDMKFEAVRKDAVSQSEKVYK